MENEIEDVNPELKDPMMIKNPTGFFYVISHMGALSLGILLGVATQLKSLTITQGVIYTLLMIIVYTITWFSTIKFKKYLKLGRQQ